MGTGTTSEWIDVEFVAGELMLSRRAAWEFIKRIGVEKTDDRPALARFRLSDYQAARDRAMRPAAPRAVRPAPAPVATPSAPEAKAAQNLAKLARLRR